MKGKDDRNHLKMLTPPPQTGWKSATPVSWLCSLGPLSKSYIEVAPNTVIGSKRHKQAFVRLEESEKVNFSKRSAIDFTDAIDDYVRMGLAHLRMLKQSAEAKERAYRKADQHQQRLLDEILELVDVKLVVEPGPTATHTEAQLVPITTDYDNQPLRASGPSGSSRPLLETTTAFQGSLDFEGIFDAVLDDEVDGVKIHYTKGNKNADKEKDKDKDKEKKYVILVKSPPGTPSPKKSPSKRQSTTRRNSGAFELALTEEDKKMLQEAQHASPISKGRKSQQQRLNEKRPPKKSKGNSKGKSAHEKVESLKANKGKNNKGTATSSNKGTGTSEKGKAGVSCKRPAAAAAAAFGDEGDDPAALPIVVPDWIPDPSTSEEQRSVIRSRYVSQGYHKTMVALKQQGYTNHDAMKAAARRAHKAAGETFDKAWPAANAAQKVEETPKNVEETPKKKDQSKKKTKSGAKTKKQNGSKNEEKEVGTKKPETPLTRKRSKGPENKSGDRNGAEMEKEAEGEKKSEVERDIEKRH